MKKRLALGLISVLSALGSAVYATRPRPDKVSAESDYRPSGSISQAAAGLNYSTGFEAPGFTPGWIGAGTMPAGCGGLANPCWGVSGVSLSVAEGHIDTVQPFAGAQHLRVAHDPAVAPATGFGRAVDARYPRSTEVAARPTAPNTVSVEAAITAPFGQDFRIQPQSLSQGGLNSSVLFFYTGSLYILDDLCGATGLNFVPVGSWDTSGAYQNYTVVLDPCTNTQTYFYGGIQIYAGCVIATMSLEQFLVFGDNYPGSDIDIDDLVLQSGDGCGVCGDGVITTEFQSEDCEPTSDANCPGRCIPPGEPNQCRCAPICTESEPCTVQNGENGPFLSSSGYYVYSGNSPFVSIDGCGTDFDAVLNVSSANSPNIFNATCSETDGDPSASCYVPSGSQPDPCVCMANPAEPILIWMSTGSSGRVPLGSSSIINIRKKAICAGASVGSCCDTNGPDQGCTDNMTENSCIGPDKIWVDQGKCATTQCACIPECTGAQCGDDGCGVSCGTCDDGNACNGQETCNANRTCDAGTPLTCNDGNACNGVETCDPQAGCRPGTPLNCNDGLACTGTESCNPQSGCVAGTPVNCDDGVDCTVDACTEPTGFCTHDDADCAIPTVSEWGLIVLALALLVAAKVGFGRRVRTNESQ